MPFVKGKSGNPAGRPKGSKNISTKAIKERAIPRLIDYFDSGRFDKDEKAMKPQERARYYLELLKIYVPRETTSKVSLAGMPPDQAAKLVLEAAGLIDEEE